jgi:hypothetical protein
MDEWQKITECKSICWLVVAAILLITLMPAHYHLHHLVQTGTTTHEHATDLHFAMNKADQAHHDENTYSFAAVPDGITKKTASAFIIFTFFTILLALLPFLNFRTARLQNYGGTSLKKNIYHFYPPLRAPPQLLQNI